MDLKSLQAYLKPDYGQVKIKTKHFDRNFDAFLTDAYGEEGQTLLIHSIEKEPEVNEEARQISFAGQADLLNVPDMPVEATFSLTPQGNVELFIVYRLPLKGKNKWSFSKSFPEQEGLDGLDFTEAAWVVSSIASQDGRWKRGINFASKVKANPALGLPAQILAPESEMELNGVYVPAVKPDRPQVPRGLKTQSQPQPWNYLSEMPGIHLEASMPGHISLGGQMLKAPQLRMYYPSSARWLEKDRSFMSVQALTSMLVGQAWVVNVTGFLGEEALRFKGAKGDPDYFDPKLLAATLGLPEGEQLFSESLQKVMEATPSVKMRDLSFTVKEGAEQMAIDRISLKLDFEDATWALQGDDLKAKDILSEVVVDFSGKKAKIEVNVEASSQLGDLPLDLNIPGKEPGPIVGELKRTSGLRLPALLQRLKAKVGDVPDLPVEEASLEIQPGKSVRVKGSLNAKGSPLQVDVSPTATGFQDLGFDFTLPEKGKAKGVVNGQISWGRDVSFDFEQDVLGDGSIKGQAENVQLSALLRRLAGQKMPLPRGFELDLPKTQLLIKQVDKEWQMQLAAALGKEGWLLLDSGKRKEGYGLALALRQGGGGLSSIPGLEGLQDLESQIKISDWTLSLANFADEKYTFADPNDLLGGKDKLSLPPKGVEEGLSIRAQWQVNPKNAEQNLIKKILGLKSKMEVEILPGNNPLRDLKLRSPLKGKILEDLTFDGGYGLSLQNGTPEFFLAGKANFALGDREYAGTLALDGLGKSAWLRAEIAEEVQWGKTALEKVEILIEVNATGAQKRSVLGTLKEEGMRVQVIPDQEDAQKVLFTGGGGLSNVTYTAAYLPRQQGSSSEDLFADLKIEGSEGIKLSLDQVAAFDERDAEAIAAVLTENGIKIGPDQLLVEVLQPGRTWEIFVAGQGIFQVSRSGNALLLKPLVQYYRADAAVKSSVGAFSRGHYLSGKLAIQGLEIEGRFDIKPGKGLSGKGSLPAPLIVNDESFFMLKGKGEQGPDLSFSTFDVKAKNSEQAAGLSLEGDLHLLGLDMGKTTLTMEREGFVFTTQEKKDLADVVEGFSGKAQLDAKIKGELTEDRSVQAGGKLALSLKGNFDLASKAGASSRRMGDSGMGSLSVDSKFTGELSLETVGRRIRAIWQGTYAYEGKKLDFSIELDPRKNGLGDLPGEALKILSSQVADYLNDPWLYLKALKAGKLGQKPEPIALGNMLASQFRMGPNEAAMLLYEADLEQALITDVLHKAYNKDAGSTGLILNQLGLEPKAVAESLRDQLGASGNDLARMLAQSGGSAAEVAEILKGVFKLNGVDTALILKEQGYKSPDLLRALKKAFRNNAPQGLKTLIGLGLDTREAALALREVFGLKAQTCGEILIAGGISAEPMSEALFAVYKVPERLMAEILFSSGVASIEAGILLRKRFRTAPAQLVDLLRSMGAKLPDMVIVLKDACGQADRQAGRILMQAGFGLMEVATALYPAYGMQDKDLFALLKTLNAGAAEYVQAVQKILSSQPLQVADLLLNSGVKAQDLAEALQQEAKLAPTEIARLFKEGGSDARSMGRILAKNLDLSCEGSAKALTEAFELDPGDLASALRYGGYSQTEIDAALAQREA